MRHGARGARLRRYRGSASGEGDSVTVSLTGIPMLTQEDDRRVVGLYGVARDVSERKRAEAHLRLQAQLLDCVHEAVVSSDLDGNIQYWNREAEALYGYTAAEVLGKPYRSIAGAVDPPDDE